MERDHMKKTKIIICLGCLSLLFLSGCIEEGNTDDVRSVSGYLDDVEIIGDNLIVHFKDDGVHKFYFNKGVRDDYSQTDSYIEIRSYLNHNVTILYYNSYHRGGGDQYFHIILED